MISLFRGHTNRVKLHLFSNWINCWTNLYIKIKKLWKHHYIAFMWELHKSHRIIRIGEWWYRFAVSNINKQRTYLDNIFNIESRRGENLRKQETLPPIYWKEHKKNVCRTCSYFSCSSVLCDVYWNVFFSEP